MKKNYEKPTVEVVKFQYRDQVVAVSGGSFFCGTHYYYERDEGCASYTVSKYGNQ